MVGGLDEALMTDLNYSGVERFSRHVFGIERNRRGHFIFVHTSADFSRRLERGQLERIA
jgi:hypothetical protein